MDLLRDHAADGELFEAVVHALKNDPLDVGIPCCRTCTHNMFWALTSTKCLHLQCEHCGTRVFRNASEMAYFYARCKDFADEEPTDRELVGPGAYPYWDAPDSTSASESEEDFSEPQEMAS